MALNRLRFHNILVKDMGQPSEAAEELAEVVDEGMREHALRIETDQKFELLIAEMRVMRAEINERITRMQLALLTALGVATATIVGLLIALLARS